MRAFVKRYAVMALMFCAALIARDAAAYVLAPGVTDKTVTVGTHVDLSGPLAPVGRAVANGLNMAFDEINAKGGVNGRTIKLDIADNGYDPKKAVAVVREMIAHNHVFAILCPVGTPPVAATMKMVLNRGILHLFPFTASDDTYEPSQLLEFANDLPVAEQISIGLAALLNQRGPLHVGVLYRNDDFGRAVRTGVVSELTRRGLPLAAQAVYRPGANDFAKALNAFRKKGVELLVMGSVSTEAIAIARQARSARFKPVMLCPSACHVPEVATLGGRAVNGIYATAMTPIPYPNDRDRKLRAWANAYERKFHTPATLQAFRAYQDARLFAEALRRSGKRPTQLRFARVLENMPTWTDPVYGGVPVNFSGHSHIGLQTVFLAQIRGGRWNAQSDPLNRPDP